MTPEQVNAFIDSRPGWLALSTIGPDGYPHTVPIGYFRLGDDIVIGCRAGTQKLRNIERNPKVSCMLEDGSTMSDIRGVVVQGRATVHTDPEELLQLAREAARARGVAEADLPAEPRQGSAYIRVRRDKVISWDYSQRDT